MIIHHFKIDIWVLLICR